MKELKKKRNVLIISIVILVVVLLGSTYAFFFQSKTAQAYTLRSGGISAEFIKGSNSINIENAYPISDSFAIQHLAELNYLDFTVKGKVPSNEAVTYEIYLTEGEGNTLNKDFIKIYLTDDTNTEILQPTIYNQLAASTVPNANDGKVILRKTETSAFESKYRLYTWIDSNYTENAANKFLFKVNLYTYNDVPGE